ncbi:MAG: phosphate acyltransferase PlsX [Candidatus Krumholzibacteriota bacterium]|nr:phosphate acyltransferase PlsX [Candidatus Krumholzibacteriota bacterium]
MRIAVDAMGGDDAPGAMIKGAVEAVKAARGEFDVVLVGKRRLIEEDISRNGYDTAHIEIVHASEIVGMSEGPATAIRRKKDSSITLAVKEHKEGRVDAVFSNGNTGAVVASSLLSLGRLRGIIRPAIAILMPTRGKYTVLLDGGANSDCYPHHLEQFAYMGSIYSETFMGTVNPKVGLLNIGKEESKGNELVRESYTLLKDSKLNFVGNVEGTDIFEGTVDVVVTDGFVGNVILKFSESIVTYLSSFFKDEMKNAFLPKLGGFLMKPAFRNLKKKLDYAEYGAMPLLGVKGAVFIGHGGSSSRAVKNGIISISRFVRDEINRKIIMRMKEDLV